MTVQPEQMVAGPELDAEIARRVFGDCAHQLVKLKDDNRDPTDDYTTWRCHSCRKTFRGLLYRSNGQTWRGLRTATYPHPRYSTDIAAAWLVVEKTRKGLFSVRMAFTQALGKIINDGNDLPVNERIAPSYWIFLLTPEIICRAALAALIGSEIPRHVH